ncbi:Lrp/AsnC family transcriptional regulator [Mycolicibacterium sp. CH28]|uniref:Lrp/AsnC family transcriptional regulator n=1 Tax=Mycolicibacterium sp. CH28 TaxID=2512237 RepID=UPI0010801399|nr:Lrp/AsnC family transcriptional regulator [Mycolicibacterium sp. CH28]TGD84546.1 Lrp/AsnC family transcriptional regulator [Mycolicibacterium sp. CH28]
MLSRLNGEILHALQLSPRVPFRRVGEVIGVPEQTVARRYRKMRRDGALRVVGLVNPRVYGESQWILRVHTKPDDLPRVADALARRPEVTHANVLSGWTELMCVVRAPLNASGDGLLHRLPRTSSVLAVDVELVLHVFGDPADAVWTGYGPALDAHQVAALQAARPAAVGDPVPPRDDDRLLLDALAEDGRVAHTQLAELTGWSPARVTRRITALESSATLTYDVDVLPEKLGFPVHAVVLLKAAPRHVQRVGQQLVGHAEIASVVAISGHNNLMAVVIVPDVDQLYRYVTEQLGAVDHIESYDVRVRTTRLKQAGSLVSRGRLITADR